MSAEPTAKPDQTFYRYVTSDGRVLLVDALDKLPAEARNKAQRIHFEGSDPSALEGTLGNLFGESAPTSHETAPAATASASLSSLHVPSFIAGVAAGVGLALVLGWLVSSRSGSFGKRIVISVMATGVFAAVLGSLYLGWLRRSTGQEGGVLATPTELIDDAKRTMDLVQERRREQQRQLDELQQLGK